MSAYQEMDALFRWEIVNTYNFKIWSLSFICRWSVLSSHCPTMLPERQAKVEQLIRIMDHEGPGGAYEQEYCICRSKDSTRFMMLVVPGFDFASK